MYCLRSRCTALGLSATVVTRNKRDNEITYSDVWRVGLAGVDVVHDFVCREERHCIRIAFERLHNRENAGQVVESVRAARIGAVDALLRRVDIDDHVDTCGIEDARAKIVVGTRVDIVNTNGVDLVLKSV